MKVAMYYNNNDVRLEEKPTPVIMHDELLFKVMACGICGSDVLEWYRIKKAPLVLGHEAAGVIEEAGSKVGKYRKGDRVFITHHVPCNTCRHCLKGSHTACDTLHSTNFYPGGFSEYVRVPAINIDRGVYPLPDDMSFDDGTFIEPLACVVRGQRLARIQAGDTVLVMGSGISGLLHMQLARSLGAANIIATDINEYRMRAAEQFGANAVIDARQAETVPERVREANDGRPVDKVIVCVGNHAVAKQALQCVNNGGTALYFAVPEPGEPVPVDMNQMWRNEVTIMTSYGAAPNDLMTSLDLLRAGSVKVRDMITHRLPLNQTGNGFKLFAAGGETMKVIIEPHK
jgi:L-iditol 2-dehydrogenase